MSKIIQSPASGKIFYISEAGERLTRFSRGVAEEINLYPVGTPFVVSFDLGQIELMRESAETMITTVDVWEKICEKRGCGGPYMFDIKEENGILKAAFNSAASEHETIFEAALDAAMTSRKHGNKAVIFEFRNKKVSVTGQDEPGKIEAAFPQNERRRKDLPPPKPFRGCQY